MLTVLRNGEFWAQLTFLSSTSKQSTLSLTATGALPWLTNLEARTSRSADRTARRGTDATDQS